MTDCIAIKTENVLLDEADPTVVFSIESERNSEIYNEKTDISLVCRITRRIQRWYLRLNRSETQRYMVKKEIYQRLDVPMQNREANSTVVFPIESVGNSEVYDEKTDLFALHKEEKKAIPYRRLDLPMQNREANPTVVSSIESERNSEVYKEKTDLSTIRRPYAESRGESNGGIPDRIGAKLRGIQ